VYAKKSNTTDGDAVPEECNVELLNLASKNLSNSAASAGYAPY
jgi:hypothetical protein